MLQVLVLTDLSKEALPGMRFAIQLSKQIRTKLLFAFVLHIPRLSRFSDQQYSKFAESERQRHTHDLEKTVAGMYKRLSVREQDYECKLIEGISAEPAIADYCRDHPEIEMICMGTHGASGLQRIFGTHAGNMIMQTGIPVIIVPEKYRTHVLNRVLYASDLEHYDEELEKVVGLAASIDADLDMIHILQRDERLPDKTIFETVLSEKHKYPISIHFPEKDDTRSLSANLCHQIAVFNPSMAVMFTSQTRSLLEKVFLTSSALNVAYSTSVPLLVYPKTHHQASTTTRSHKVAMLTKSR